MGILSLGLLLLFFLLIRGCQHSNNQQQQIALQDSAISRLREDTARINNISRINKENYDNSLAYANGLLDLRQNKLESTEARLLATSIDYAFLKKKYENVQPDMDTSVTLVPNMFINDCHDCFDSLDFKNQLIKLYVREVKDVDSAHRMKEELYTGRIGELTVERNTYRKNSEDAIIIAAKAQASAEPRRKVFLSLGIMGKKDYLLMGVGAGGFYLDKKQRMFGLNAYGTNQGPLVTANLGLPLSFKKR